MTHSSHLHNSHYTAALKALDADLSGQYCFTGDVPPASDYDWNTEIDALEASNDEIESLREGILADMR